MSKSMLFAVGSCCIMLGAGATVVWPSYRRTAVIEQEIRELQSRIDTAGALVETVEALSAQVRDTQQTIEADLRSIPSTPDVAGLMRKLSLPVDGVHVRDQTFTAGSPTSALQGTDDDTTHSMPITVDMLSTFDSVFALMRAAESMDRLVRIASVRLACKRPDEKAPPDQADAPATPADEVPVLAASIGLDAIYESTGTEDP